MTPTHQPPVDPTDEMKPYLCEVADDTLEPAGPKRDSQLPHLDG